MRCAASSKSDCAISIICRCTACPRSIIRSCCRRTRSGASGPPCRSSAAGTTTASASSARWPLRLWGAGWSRSPDPVVRGLVAGGPVLGHDKLCVYSGSTLSLNHHHPMNDIVGGNTRTFELAAVGACQLVDAKDELAQLFKPGDEVLVYRDLAELRRVLDHFLARPDEARAIGENARRRALAEHTLAHRVDEMLHVLEERFKLGARS